MKADKTYRVVLIDDHPIFREGFKAVLHRDPRFLLAGASGVAREGVQAVHTLKPDLVVMEMWLGSLNTVPIIRKLKRPHPGTRAVVLTTHKTIKYAVQALAAGADGFFLKNCEAPAFLNDCERILNGEQRIDRSFSPELASDMWAAARQERRSPAGPDEYLTPREREVIQLIAEGLPRKEIAKMLCISPKTVENHITRIMRRLSLHNTVELIRWAAGLGLINMEEWIGKSVQNPFPEGNRIQAIRAIV